MFTQQMSPNDWSTHRVRVRDDVIWNISKKSAPIRADLARSLRTWCLEGSLLINGEPCTCRERDIYTFCLLRSQTVFLKSSLLSSGFPSFQQRIPKSRCSGFCFHRSSGRSVGRRGGERRGVHHRCSYPRTPLQDQTRHTQLNMPFPCIPQRHKQVRPV